MPADRTTHKNNRTNRATKTVQKYATVLKANKTTPNGVFFISGASGGFPRTASCGAFVITRTSQRLFSFTHCRTGNLMIAWFKSINHNHKNKKHPQRGVFYFWWEWLDSNQLRLKPTDLQSAPALQLRRTPNLVKIVKNEKMRRF